MIPKEIKYNLHYDDIRGDFLRPPVYISVVLPTLLYAFETWSVYQRHAKRLNHFYTSCGRKRLTIKCQDRIQYTEVLKRAGMQRFRNWHN